MDTGLQAYAQTLDYLARRLISPMQQIENKKTQINGLGRRMDIALQSMLKTHQQHVLSINNSLQQLNPQNVLARGFSLVYDEKGELLSNSQQLKVNQQVSITLHQGGARATVTDINDD
jgi:exodeoxyribonuclease VII large subunit